MLTPVWDCGNYDTYVCALSPCPPKTSGVIVPLVPHTASKRSVLAVPASLSALTGADRKVKIPKTPPAPTDPPVYITEKEYINHVRPLHWYRWSINYLNRDLYLRGGELHSGSFVCPYLKRDLFFRGFENAKRFMDRLYRIFRADKVSNAGHGAV